MLYIFQSCLNVFRGCNHLEEEERTSCFAFIVLRMSCYCKCSVILSHSAVGWSAVCDCGISWSYSLTFWTSTISNENKVSCTRTQLRTDLSTALYQQSCGALQSNVWKISQSHRQDEHVRKHLRVHNWKIIVSFLNQNICCGYSKELSQWDSSLEHPKHMLKIMGRKIFTI